MNYLINLVNNGLCPVPVTLVPSPTWFLTSLVLSPVVPAVVQLILKSPSPSRSIDSASTLMSPSAPPSGTSRTVAPAAASTALVANNSACLRFASWRTGTYPPDRACTFPRTFQYDTFLSFPFRWKSGRGYACQEFVKLSASTSRHRYSWNETSKHAA